MTRTYRQTDIASTRPVGFASGKKTKCISLLRHTTHPETNHGSRKNPALKTPCNAEPKTGGVQLLRQEGCVLLPELGTLEKRGGEFPGLRHLPITLHSCCLCLRGTGSRQHGTEGARLVPRLG